jgi:hypothetical protein
VNDKTSTDSSEAKRRDQLRDLAKRAQRGDKKTLPALRELLKDPAVVDAWGGDLARQAQLMLVNKFAGKSLLFKEAVPRKLDALRKEMSGANPTPLERLLIERVVSCWLHLHQLEIAYTNSEEVTFELGSYYERCITSAQKRYLAAIKTLVLVRRLAVPVLQVNIAKEQVNMAGRCVTAESEKTK